MPIRKPKAVLACLGALAALALAGCGGDDEPEPSIPIDSATTLVSTLQEVQDNVDVGSCLIAAGKVQEFQQELSALSSGVNQQVVDALQRGALSLGDLVDEDCEGGQETTTQDTTTDEPTTTQDTTTDETTTDAPTTTTTPTETTPTDPSTGGGGVGPPGGDGL